MTRINHSLRYLAFVSLLAGLTSRFLPLMSFFFLQSTSFIYTGKSNDCKIINDTDIDF